ncbi:MAG: (2Fe-2S)-binding protein [Candidatus Dormibacteria bacterium]|jgi:aerobic-type carbon monoxide dehydrogenase small subunit (CoxS/CutS family)
MPEPTPVTIECTVNGRLHRWQSPPGATLLEALREAHVRGPKLVCGTGDCCACGVMLNGRSVNSCCTLAAQAAGATVLTVEGLAEDGQLHPLQAAFLETGAAQCGFCTPGLLIRAYALLQAQPDPDEAAVRVALGGNICRCTGYVKPVEAVLEAARRMRAAAADATRQGSVEPGLPASDSALR